MTALQRTDGLGQVGQGADGGGTAAGGGGGGTAGKGVGRAVSEGGNKKAGGAAGKRTAANENDTPTAGMQWFALVKAGASAKAYQVHRHSQSHRHCRLLAVHK